MDTDSRSSLDSATAVVRQQLEDLEHDHTVLSQILSLVSSLKNTYKVSYLLPKRGIRPIHQVGSYVDRCMDLGSKRLLA